MTSSPLDNLVRIGKLKAEPPVQAEFAGLVRSGLVRLRDAENATLSLESRFDLATTRRMPCRWRRCVGMATVPKTAIWYSRA